MQKSKKGGRNTYISKPPVLTKRECINYSGIDKEINNNFYFLNGHGEELEADYEIPNGVRIIMFCYSGETLNICHRFDKFNWSNILLDPSVSSNYFTFLSAISEYSSINDHFCVYEGGDTIKNIQLHSDPHFREGLFRLPVRGFVYDKSSDTVVISNNTPMSQVQKHPQLRTFFKNKRKKIRIDDRRLVNLMRENNEVTIIESYVRKIHKTIRLSNLINSMKPHGDFTILLMVCREGIGSDTISKGEGIGSDTISKGKVIKDEVLRMKRQIVLEQAMRE